VGACGPRSTASSWFGDVEGDEDLLICMVWVQAELDCQADTHFDWHVEACGGMTIVPSTPAIGCAQPQAAQVASL
jgi:hypothetical protein